MKKVERSDAESRRQTLRERVETIDQVLCSKWRDPKGARLQVTVYSCERGVRLLFGKCTSEPLQSNRVPHFDDGEPRRVKGFAEPSHDTVRLNGPRLADVELDEEARVGVGDGAQTRSSRPERTVSRAGSPRSGAGKTSRSQRACSSQSTGAVAFATGTSLATTWSRRVISTSSPSSTQRSTWLR